LESTDQTAKEESKKLSDLEKQALKDLVGALVQKGFLRITTTTNDPEYEITGAVLPTTTTKARIKEEDNFLDEYKKFVSIIYVYSKLYLRYSENTFTSALHLRYSDYTTFEQTIESDIDYYPPKLKEVISSRILESYKGKWRDIYIALTHDTKEQYKREELEEHIKNIRITSNEILYNFILLIKTILQNKDRDVTIGQLDLEGAKEIDARFTSISIPRDLHVPILLIGPASQKTKSRQLLIIENAPEQVSESITQFIDKHRSNFNALILKVKTSLTNDSLENPEKLLELKYISEDKRATLWHRSWLIMEIPTDKQLFADAIEGAFLWLSYIRQLNSIIEKGSELFSDSKYQEAMECYNKALDLDPSFAEAFYDKGLVLFALEKYQEAMECYNKALDSDPSFADVTNELLVKLAEKEPAAAAVAETVSNNFDKLPEDVRNQLLVKLAEKEPAAAAVAETVSNNFDKLPEDVRNQLLVKLAQSKEATAHVAYAVAHYFDKLPNEIQNLLFKLTDNKEVAGVLGNVIRDNFDKLPEDVRNQLLVKLAEKEPAAAAVAETVSNNFDKLPENVRNQLLVKLPDKERRVAVEKFAREEKPILSGELWADLVASIDRKQCIPFIGAEASGPWLPSSKQIANEWAKEYNYPLEESSQLAKVAQFLAIERGDDLFPKELLSDELRRTKLPDFSSAQFMDTPYSLLADLNLPIYITTNYDYIMEEALKSRGKNPLSEFCRWNDNLIEFAKSAEIHSVFDKRGTFEPTTSEPLVYHLFGTIDIPQSMVLTERDYREFVSFLNKEDEKKVLPVIIRKGLLMSTLLFIGYSLEDVNFETIFESILGSILGSGRMVQKKNIAVQSPPSSHLNKEEKAKAMTYLEQHANDVYGMHVYWGDVFQFTKELRNQLYEISRSHS
jgi:tetratricopeptide (TPR) repeat protein